jgi:hypothetical protein
LDQGGESTTILFKMSAQTLTLHMFMMQEHHKQPSKHKGGGQLEKRRQAF